MEGLLWNWRVLSDGFCVPLEELLSLLDFNFLYYLEGWLSTELLLVAQPCPTLCDPMNCSMASLPVHHQLPEFTQTLVH